MLAILVLVGIFLSTKKQPKQANETNDSGTLTKAKVEEEIKDGVYTNYTYGFRFEYPEEIFDKINPWSESSNNKKFFVEGSIPYLVIDTPQMVVGVLSTSYDAEYYHGFYNDCVATSPGVLLRKTPKSGSSFKRYNLEDICVTESTPEGLKDGEASWAYGATIPYGNDYIYLTLGETDPLELESLKQEFDSMVKSFEFLDE